MNIEEELTATGSNEKSDFWEDVGDPLLQYNNGEIFGFWPNKFKKWYENGYDSARSTVAVEPEIRGLDYLEDKIDEIDLEMRESAEYSLAGSTLGRTRVSLIKDYCRCKGAKRAIEEFREEEEAVQELAEKEYLPL